MIRQGSLTVALKSRPKQKRQAPSAPRKSSFYIPEENVKLGYVMHDGYWTKLEKVPSVKKNDKFEPQKYMMVKTPLQGRNSTKISRKNDKLQFETYQQMGNKPKVPKNIDKRKHSEAFGSDDKTGLRDEEQCVVADGRKKRPKIELSRLNCSDCRKCLKYTLIAYSLVWGILGVILLSVGLWMMRNSDRVTITVTFFGDIMEFVSYALMGFGIALVIMAGLGGVGAKSENQCMLTMFSVLLGTTLFIQLGTGKWVYSLAADWQGVVAGSGLTGVTLTAIGLFLSTFMCCYARKGRPRRKSHAV